MRPLIYTVSALIFALFLSAAAKADTITLDPNTTQVLRSMVEPRSILPIVRAFSKLPVGEKTLVIDSYGGSVDAGMALIQVMRIDQKRGSTYRCIVTGNAMSMGFFILSACDERYVLKDSQLLWHPIRVNIRGTLTGTQAKVLALDLLRFEGPLLKDLIAAVGMPRSAFLYHWNNESVHHGIQLADETGYVEVVDSIVGMPLNTLFQSTDEPNFGGLFDIRVRNQKTKFIWIAPSYIRNALKE